MSNDGTSGAAKALIFSLVALIIGGIAGYLIAEAGREGRAAPVFRRIRFFNGSTHPVIDVQVTTASGTQISLLATPPGEFKHVTRNFGFASTSGNSITLTGNYSSGVPPIAVPIPQLDIPLGANRADEIVIIFTAQNQFKAYVWAHPSDDDEIGDSSTVPFNPIVAP